MAGPTHTTDAWVLAKRPPSDAFQTLTVFSVADGSVLALQRLSKKATPVSALDLFDEASLVLETPTQGQALFVKEARILQRRSGIGRSYDSLRLASAFASLVARNPVAEDSRGDVYALLRLSFDAFANSERPDIVYLKSVYRFCRDEGYPLKQAWAPTLPPADRETLAEVLNQPLEKQSADARIVARLQRKLDDYLRGETEILLD